MILDTLERPRLRTTLVAPVQVRRGSRTVLVPGQIQAHSRWRSSQRLTRLSMTRPEAGISPVPKTPGYIPRHIAHTRRPARGRR